MKLIATLTFILSFAFLSAQGNPETAILKTILQQYYKNEKAIYKGRNQLLFFYCEKANNNEEIFQTINELQLPKNIAQSLKKQVAANSAAENWVATLNEIYAQDHTNLKMKINDCQSLEAYQEKQKRFNLNNQRLMIVSKPIIFPEGTSALVKVVFYRSIEHNSGSVLLLEKIDDKWAIKEFLNPWAT